MNIKNKIDGVEITQLKLLPNEKGRLMEVQRRDDTNFPGFGQIYLTQSYAGVIKAWYRHRVQIDQIATIIGLVKLVLYDDRKTSPTCGEVNEIMFGELMPRLVLIPPGVWHGFQAVGDTSAFLLHLNSEPFLTDAPDEERLDPYDPTIPYTW